MSPSLEQCAAHEAMAREFRESLDKILAVLDELREGQVVRREICAAQRARIEALERDIGELKNTEARELWQAVNELRRLVHRGAGLVLAMAAAMPLVTGMVVYILTRGTK